MPTSIISNLQITEAASAGASYAFTPKLSLSANVQTSYLTGAASVAVSNSLLNTFTTAQHSYGANAKMAYTITPFLSANLSYQYTKTAYANLTTNDSLILLALNFNPY